MNDNENKSNESSATQSESKIVKKTKTSMKPYAAKTKIIIISAVVIVLIAAIIIIGLLYSNKNKSDDPLNDYDVNDTGIFVTETDSLCIDSISNNVIGTGVLFESTEIYAEASAKSEVVNTLEGGTTLLVYAADGDYYKVSNAENTISGYILKKKLNTGGLDLGSPETETQIVDDTTGKVVGTKNNTSSDVNPEDFPVNSSPYFIYVEKGSHTITIYAKDGDGKYTLPVRTYLTATGRTASLTPVGNFSIKAKEQWHSWGKSYSPYCSKYYGGLFFHGPLYRKKNFGTLYEDSVSAIGTNASSGCMRTSVNAAYFIYAFCPVGTNVKIVNGAPLGRGAGKPSVKSQYVDPATNRVPVAGISFNFKNKSISIGEKITVKVEFTPSSASEQDCVWTSSNKKIAAVSGNKNSCTITGKSAGKATITATSVDGSYKASFTVYVTDESSSEAESTDSITESTTASSTEPDQSNTNASANESQTSSVVSSDPNSSSPSSETTTSVSGTNESQTSDPLELTESN